MNKQTKQGPRPTTEDDTAVTVSIMIIGGIVFAVAMVVLFLLSHSAGLLG